MHENPDLFALVAGGYGLFGAVVGITLHLGPRTTLLREVRTTRATRLMSDFDAAIAAGCTYGDFQFTVDAASDDFLDLGILSCYRPVDGEPGAAPRRSLDARDFSRLLARSEEHTSELQSLMRISYAVFCLQKKKIAIQNNTHTRLHAHTDR